MIRDKSGGGQGVDSVSEVSHVDLHFFCWQTNQKEREAGNKNVSSNSVIRESPSSFSI